MEDAGLSLVQEQKNFYDYLLPTLLSYQGLYIFFELIPYLTLYIAHIPQTF